MRYDTTKKDTFLNHLKVLSKGYSTGCFDELFPLLAEDCVLESMWVMTPNTGKDAVVDYLIGKGETLIRHNACPECAIVELIGNINPIKNAVIHINGGEAQKSSLGLWYPSGKPAMLMCQNLEDKSNAVLVDITINEHDMISRIDLCIPELFNFKVFEEPPANFDTSY